MNTMTLLGIDIGKHSFHLHGHGHPRPSGFAQEDDPWTVAQKLGAATNLHGGDGVLRWRSLVGSGDWRIGTRGEVDRSAVRQAVRQR